MIRRIFKKLNHEYQAKKAVLEAVGLYGRKETLRTKKLRRLQRSKPKGGSRRND